MSNQLYSFTFWRSLDEMSAVFICKASHFDQAEKKAEEELDKWNKTSTRGGYILLKPEWRDKEALERGEVVFVG
jgi:hypothetical protein